MASDTEAGRGDSHGLVMAADAAPRVISVTDVLTGYRASDPYVSPSPAEERAVRAVAFVWYLVLQTAPGAKAEDGVVRESAGEVARICGISKGAAERATADLETAGVAVRQKDGIKIPAEFWAPYPVAGRIDWERVRHRIHGRTQEALLFRTLLDLIEHPEHWQPIPVDALTRRAGYARMTAMRGLTGLVEQGLIDKRARTGEATEYRYAPDLLGRDAASSEPTTSQSSTPGSAPVTGRPSPKAEGDANRLEIAGVEIAMPPGVAVRIERDSEGRLTYCIGPHMRLGPFPE